MQVLRVGGEYLAACRRSARMTLVIIVGTGAVGVAAVSIAVHPIAGGLLGVVIVSVAARVHKRLSRVSKGIKGEALVAECLERLPDDYFLLNDVVLPGHLGNVDHIVIGPCGVVVIETKHFSGSVESHRNAWFANGHPCPSVSKQVNRNAIAVREALSRAHPDLQGSTLRFVESVAVFTNLSTRVKVDQAQTIVARYSQLLDVIRVIARRKKVPRTVATRLAESLRTLTSSARSLERPWAGGMTGQRQRP